MKKWHQRRGIQTAFLIALFLHSIAFGQTDDSAVDFFPFSDGQTDERTVEYSDQLYDITDDGVVTPDGQPLLQIPSAEELTDSITPDPAVDPAQEYREGLLNQWGDKRDVTQKRLEMLNDTIAKERAQFSALDSTVAQLEEKLQPIHLEIESLKGQVDHLNDQIAETQHKIETVEFQIADKQVMIRALMDDIKKKEIELNVQGDVVLEYIRLVYEEEEKFLGFDQANDQLKLLLADNSVSENLLGRDYLTVLEATGRKVFYDLYVSKRTLEAKQESLVKARQQLDELHESLTNEKSILDENRRSQKELLLETRGQQEEYQRLLEQSTQQRLESAIAIQNLEDNRAFVESKLSLLNDSLDKATQMQASSEFNEQLNALDETIQLVVPDDLKEGTIPRHQSFAWPVPASAVTTYYRDPTYPKKWGLHNAIDIRAPQFTSIRAPANAVVYQVKDNGFGYSYIILAHKNNLVTVYGHVSSILVEQGMVVQQGDVIGLTGGTPGTKGAGLQTTGPHLHFEVYFEGKSVDPLDFLPVMELPVEYIPEKYFTSQ
ncbi:peptidoglycan DD-metalloendopeptidase family protein [Candidatus Peregrinibacteria bacterium]|nr:MAG: peptidoglycan DD-metalloendopeptidase family protein [Candidatus Peregrinibacteria bacterium]